MPVFSTDGLCEFIEGCKILNFQLFAMYNIYGKLDSGYGETGAVSGFCSTYFTWFIADVDHVVI